MYQEEIIHTEDSEILEPVAQKVDVLSPKVFKVGWGFDELV